MTRKEQIKEIAQKEMSKYPNFCITAPAFRMGAEWADAHPHWISVEDELPPLGCSMIVLISYGEDIQISEWDNGLFHETKLGAIIHPTYWMPLPQAPSSSEKPNNCEKGGEK